MHLPASTGDNSKCWCPECGGVKRCARSVRRHAPTPVFVSPLLLLLPADSEGPSSTKKRRSRKQANSRASKQPRMVANISHADGRLSQLQDDGGCLSSGLQDGHDIINSMGGLESAVSDFLCPKWPKY